MTHKGLALPLLSALALTLLGTVSNANETADCLLVVDGTTYLNGRCPISQDEDILTIGTDGENASEYWAQIWATDTGEMGYWNEEPNSNHAHSELGELHHEGDCWTNRRAKICFSNVSNESETQTDAGTQTETSNDINQQSTQKSGPSFEETVNFIFTTNKAWSTVNWGGRAWELQLSEYDQQNCSVHIKTRISNILLNNGTLTLNGLKRWNGNVINFGDESGHKFPYSQFVVEADGTIFEGRFFDASISKFEQLMFANLGQAPNSCEQRCAFAIPPNTDWERLKKAFEYLYTNYCKAGEADPF